MVRAKYKYARKKLIEELKDYLSENLDEQYRVYDAGDDIIGGKPIRVLTIMGTELKPSLIIIDSFVQCHFNSDLEDLTKSLSSVYSAEECNKKISYFAGEHTLRSMELCLKIDALPSDSIKYMSEFAQYYSQLKEDSRDHVLQLYKILNRDNAKTKTWLQKLLNIDDEKQKELKKVLETYLGEEIISLDEELYG